MNNIDKAIERLDEITSVRCGGGFAHFPAIDLNDCRSEIKALIAANAALVRCGTSGETDEWLNWDDYCAAIHNALTTLIAKILR